MDKIERLIANLDAAERDGLDVEDESSRLRSARYHKSAFDQFSEKFENEQDEDERARLRELISFHRDRLNALLG